MTLREATNIALTGYGPCAQFTLEEWLHARDMYRNNQSAALKQLHFKDYNSKELGN